MSKIVLPHDAWVFVGDGKKALFLRNAGDERSVNLKAERVYAEDNPPTREQGTDHPGRAFKRAGTNQRGSVEGTDWAAAAETSFRSTHGCGYANKLFAIARCNRL